MKIDYLPFSKSKWRDICSSVTSSMIKIEGTNENSNELLKGVVRLSSRASIIINVSCRAKGCIKIPFPHIPDLHTTPPVLQWEWKVMVF
jgi:hypothetical protein